MRLLRIMCLLVLISTVFVPLCVFAQSNYTESLTVTTYYPAPYGVYGVLKLKPQTKTPPPCSEGEIIYDNSTIPASRGMYYCNSLLTWTKLSGGGGAGGSFWLENPATHNIYNNNTGGKVGIGTNNPASKLSVHGGTLGSNTDDSLWLQEIDSNLSDGQYLRTFTKRIAPGGTDWNTAELYLQRSINNTNMGFIKWPAGNAGIGFGSAVNEHMRINPNGNVGIGTITPAQKLEVVGNIRANGDIRVAQDICNDAGKCLSQVPACPCGITIVPYGTPCPVGTSPFMYHYSAGPPTGFISCASSKLTCYAGMYGTATMSGGAWATSTPCADISVNCDYCGGPFTAHVCAGGPYETACRRP